jgi:hypothetical protein
MPWRSPEHPDDFPSLGWELLDWWAEYLPSPRDSNAPLLFTDEQALQIVEWFRLDPIDGGLVYRRGYSRRAKGWGKSPVEAAKAIAEFAGPVRFAGWDARGEPVGMPWGTKDAPRAWVQIGAISEDQTDNTWSVVHYLLTENDGKAADALGIDAGLTRCFLRGQPGAKMEPTTSASGSREGQPITYGVLDESHLMLPTNGGVRLARTIRRNVAKMGGRSYETTNAYAIGQESVAESSHAAVLAGSPGIFADEVEAPREVDGVPVNQFAGDDVLLAALTVAYGDSWWVDKVRLLADMRDPSTPWDELARFFLNWPQNDSAAGVISVAKWEDLADPPDPKIEHRGSLPRDDTVRLALDAPPDRRSATFGMAGIRDDGYLHVSIRHHCRPTQPGDAALKDRVIDMALKLTKGHNTSLILPPSSPARAWKADLVAAGVSLDEMTPAEYAEACGRITNAVDDGALRHRGQPELNNAVAGLAVRSSGDVDAWSRRNSSANIAPFVAATCALVRVPDHVQSTGLFLAVT